MLTGKAKSDFENWYWNDWLTASDRDYYEKDEVIENSWKAEKLFLFPLIIEWLDSVRIYVETYIVSDYGIINFSFNISGSEIFDNEFAYQSRAKATEKAIIKANEIYNSQ